VDGNRGDEGERQTVALFIGERESGSDVLDESREQNAPLAVIESDIELRLARIGGPADDRAEAELRVTDAQRGGDRLRYDLRRMSEGW
jgi:hypothetical protein